MRLIESHGKSDFDMRENWRKLSWSDWNIGFVWLGGLMVRVEFGLKVWSKEAYGFVELNGLELKLSKKQQKFEEYESVGWIQSWVLVVVGLIQTLSGFDFIRQLVFFSMTQSRNFKQTIKLLLKAFAQNVCFIMKLSWRHFCFNSPPDHDVSNEAFEHLMFLSAIVS
jgi:hypothetical protein